MRRRKSLEARDLPGVKSMLVESKIEPCHTASTTANPRRSHDLANSHCSLGFYGWEKKERREYKATKVSMQASLVSLIMSYPCALLELGETSLPGATKNYAQNRATQSFPSVVRSGMLRGPDQKHLRV
jgi:hypothetical protein